MHRKLIPILLLLSAALPGFVQAKGITWNSGVLPTLDYFSNNSPTYSSDTVPLTTTPGVYCNPYTEYKGCQGWQGWSQGLSGETVNVAYHANLVNVDTGAPIPDNANVPIGTRIKIDPVTYGPSDISWMGTGYSLDSPFGYWVANAGPTSKACHAEDYLNAAIDYFGTLGVYVMLNVNPPANWTSSASGNLSCSRDVCTVTGPGAITIGRTFNGTQGRFYYRYYDYRPSLLGCHANNAPMALDYPGFLYYNAYYGYWTNNSASNAPNVQIYTLQIPSQTVTYNLTAVSAASPPAVPTLTCPPSLTAGQSGTFTVSSTDPNNHQIHYGLDWTGSAATPNEWVPAAGYVPSGTSQNVTHAWAANGTYTVRALAQNDQGASSAWSAPCTVTVMAPPTASLSVTPVSIALSQPATLSWSSSNATSCTGSGFSTGGATSGTKPVSPSVTTPYGVTCTNAAGSASASQILTVVQPNATITASPSRVRAGGTSTISWTSTDVNACRVSGPDLLVTSKTGSKTVTVNTQSTYTITCTTTGQPVTDSVIVDVTPGFVNF